MNIQFSLFFIIVLSISLATISCQGPAGSDGLQGPQGEQGPPGPEGPQGEQGPPGNANVTLHIFEGHDFSSDSIHDICFENVTEEGMISSYWLVYLVFDSGNPFGFIYAHVPGFGLDDTSQYDTAHIWDTSGTICPSPQMAFEVELNEGPGEAYDEIRIFQVTANHTIDNRSKQTPPLLPEYLDITDYQTVTRYFGIRE